MDKISWAPKIRPAKVRQLYQNDARGSVDQVLVEEVGTGLLQRCHSIWLVTRREVECPRCEAVFPLSEPGTWRLLPGVLRCPTPGCGWETTAEEWHTSWRHRDLLGTAVMQAVETYLQDYPCAQRTEERMVCIDQLIHTFHSPVPGKLNRSFANNLIEGSHDQVVELLDGLSARPDGVDKEEWRANIQRMYARRRAQD